MSIKLENTIKEEILAFLFSARSTSIRRRLLWEYMQKRQNLSNKAYNQHIYRLKKNKYILINDNNISLSEKGLILINNPYKYIKLEIKKKNKILIIFDIPENKKKTRNWLRKQIKLWNFKMIQKSVWLGWGPVPDNFKKRLIDLEIDKNVKIFNLINKQDNRN